jgi:hypothetical protein
MGVENAARYARHLCGVFTSPRTSVRDFVLTALSPICVDMAVLLRNATRSTRRPNDLSASRDEMARPSRTRVRSWTGRSAMSRSTDSPVPSFVTAGAPKTRVSEMRSLPRARRLLLTVESTDSATATLECRNRGVNAHQHRWNG